MNVKKLRNKRKIAERKQARKNFFPTLLVIFSFWGLLAALIYLVNPSNLGAVPVFFILFFGAVLFTFSAIFINTRRGLLTAILLTLFLISRLFNLLIINLQLHQFIFFALFLVYVAWLRYYILEIHNNFF